jgi:myo-inositol-1(or 4)-monophosphatase
VLDVINAFPIASVSAALHKVGDYYRNEFKTRPVPADWDTFKLRFEEIETKILHDLKLALEGSFPDTPWCSGEFDFREQEKRPKLSDYWICDAMDGAVQYMQQLPGWTINLVLMREGTPYLAAVYEPLAQELFWAVAGQGAYLNDARLTPSTKTEPRLLLVAFDHPPFVNKIEGLSGRIGRSVESLLRDFGTVRNYGPHSLQIASVAAGRIDIFSQEGLDTYNWLPGIFIAQEAGAAVATTSGEKWKWGADSLLVASSAVAENVFRSIRAPQ